MIVVKPDKLVKCDECDRINLYVVSVGDRQARLCVDCLNAAKQKIVDQIFSDSV